MPTMSMIVQKPPFLVYKVLAVCCTVERADQVRKAFKTAYKNIKPTAALIVGMTRSHAKTFLRVKREQAK